MSTPPDFEATLTYTPLTTHKPPNEKDSCRLQDLLACPKTAQLFTLLTARIEIEQRSARSAKQLFCPSCPKSSLRISSQTGLTLIKCPICGWDAQQSGVTSVAELLQRDADPYPWISNHIRTLTRKAEASIKGNNTHFQYDWSAAASTKLSRANSFQLVRNRASLRKIQHAVQAPATAESATACAQKFAQDLQKKEAEVFAKWMPEERDCLEENIAAPKENLDALMGEVNLDDIIEENTRMCSRTWWKRDMAAKRRVPKPNVVARSPFGDMPVACGADSVFPMMQVWIRDGCGTRLNDDIDKQLLIRVHNRIGSAQLDISITNANAPSQQVRATIAGGETSELTLRPFSFDDCKVADMVHGKWMCDKLGALDVSIKYTGNMRSKEEWMTEHEWQLRAYARHTRRKRQ